jgi:hypothetical protein
LEKIMSLVNSLILQTWYVMQSNLRLVKIIFPERGSKVLSVQHQAKNSF